MRKIDKDKMEDFERLLLFFYVLKNIPEDKDEQIKRFRQISGMSEQRTRSALDVCILKGFVYDHK